MSMSHVEFVELLAYIDKHHRFGHGGKSIKYVQPVYDMRFRDIHCITLVGIEEVTLSLVNENKDRDLKQWIYQWLSDE